IAITTSNALVDTGADASIIVNLSFARKLRKLLKLPFCDDFDPGYVTPYKKAQPDSVSVALKGHIKIQNFRVKDQWIIVLLSLKRDMIIGNMWLAKNDILIDPARSRLLFPLDWKTDWSRDLELGKDSTPTKHPDFQKDAEAREALLEKEDKRRRDGRENHKV
ncbi:hypothetical protein NEUTE2DRAFT_142371, partial [Neurospora tetrasperma FGSC 2509]